MDFLRFLVFYFILIINSSFSVSTAIVDFGLTSFDKSDFAIIVSMFAGMITAGVPGGGVISNTIIVSILGFPIEALPILIAIEWILDAPATVFNVLSDTSTLPLVDKVVKRRKDEDITTETVQQESVEQ